MGQSVWVKVVGFSDAERHALNTLFRLSGQRESHYLLWTADAGAAPQLALIDSQSYEAQLEFALPSNLGLPMAWIGPDAPAGAWRSFQRPLRWPEVIVAMDGLFRPAPPVDLDLDLDLGLDAPAAARAPGKRALIASAELSHRLYLRARLALAGITQADEAENGSQALELARRTRYEVALLDFGLPGVSGWELVGRIAEARPRIPHVIVTKEQVSAGERVRAWWRGHEKLLGKPPHPGKLSLLLAKV